MDSSEPTVPDDHSEVNCWTNSSNGRLVPRAKGNPGRNRPRDLKSDMKALEEEIALLEDSIKENRASMITPEVFTDYRRLPELPVETQELEIPTAR